MPSIGAKWSSIACFGHAKSNSRVYYVDESKNLLTELAWDGKWTPTQFPQAPTPRPGSALTCFGVRTTNTRLYFLVNTSNANENDVFELAWEPGWNVTNLTQHIAAPPARAGSALACFGVGGTDSRVYYLGTDNHVYELAWANGWGHNDISKLTGAPAALTGSALACFGVNGADSRVYYLTEEGAQPGQAHVIELAWANNWKRPPVNVTAQTTGAKQAQAGSALACFGVNGSDSRVYYFDSDGHVNELAWANNNWSPSDITKGTNGIPLSNIGSPLACFGVNNSDSRVYYVTDNIVCELRWANGWKFNNLDGQVPGGTTTRSPMTALACFGVNNSDLRVYYFDNNNEVNELAWANKWVRNPL
jgi:hypothetical protein